ncbi:hypothetical protein BKA61DRAFT_720035 [Leptodontidium sp. MPI-SDFR-AT-0119]|nr:hypothetical protein BKA61DRAFT_720035 [Leptodontidium sp. MPI-SDFR-AT-0119]
MASSTTWSARLTLAAVFLLAICHQIAAYDVVYCANFNTAETPRNFSLYQTNSLCYEYCNGDTDLQSKQYALAVVQFQGCWCTDYAPTTTTTGCTQTCPGWPGELCGNTSPVLYGYVELPASISGSRGPSSSTSSSANQVSSFLTRIWQATVTSSVTTSSTTASSMSSSTNTESTMTTQQSSSTASTSSTWTPTPVTSLETITGQVRTVTVTPTVPPNAQATNGLAPAKKGSGNGLSTGGAVGLTIGLVALVAIIAAAIFFFLRKRRRDQEAAETLSRRGSSAGFGAAAVPSRTMSENSRYVLGTDGRRVRLEKSRLIPVDQRLDPFSPVYQRGDNKSRESVNTIRDDHDYSRRMVTGGTGILRATNPD